MTPLWFFFLIFTLMAPWVFQHHLTPHQVHLFLVLNFIILMLCVIMIIWIPVVFLIHVFPGV